MKQHAQRKQPYLKRWKIIFKGSKEDVKKHFVNCKDKIKFVEGHTKSKNEFHAAVYFYKRYRETSVKKKFNCAIVEPILDEGSFVKYLKTLQNETSDSCPIIFGKFETERQQHQVKKNKLFFYAEKLEKNGESETIIDTYENNPDDIFLIKPAEKLLHMKKNADLKLKLLQQAKQVEWKPWQQHLFNSLAKEPHPRRIFVIVDPVGNSGKSFFVQNYYRLFSTNTVLISNTRDSDMLYVAKNALERRVILLDLSRSDANCINFGVIESLKNGFFVSSKYRSSIVDGPPPHFVIFTNSELDYKALSLDRWFIVRLKHKKGSNLITWTIDKKLDEKIQN